MIRVKSILPSLQLQSIDGRLRDDQMIDLIELGETQFRPGQWTYPSEAANLLIEQQGKSK